MAFYATDFQPIGIERRPNFYSTLKTLNLFNEVEARPDSSLVDNPSDNPNITRNPPAPKTGHSTPQDGFPVSLPGMNEEVETTTDPTSPDDVFDHDPYFPLRSVDSLIKMNQGKGEIIGSMQKRLDEPPLTRNKLPLLFLQ